MINDWKSIIAYCKKSKQSKALANKFVFIHEMKVQLEQHPKIQKSFVNWEKKLEVQPEKNTQKNLHLNLWVNWERLCLNLSFTVAKKDR